MEIFRRSDPISVTLAQQHQLSCITTPFPFQN
jgi:hypothetical protein